MLIALALAMATWGMLLVLPGVRVYPWPEITRQIAGLLMVLTGIAVLIWLLVPRTRLSLAAFLQRHSPLAWFDVDSDLHVHATALMLAAAGVTLSTAAAAGGAPGLATSLGDDGFAEAFIVLSLAVTTALMLAIALAGVGWGTRRSWPAVRLRIGLGPVRPGRIALGVVAGGGLYVVSILLSMVWLVLAGPEAFAAQTSAAQEVFSLYDASLLTAFMLAASAAIGEEVLFRGAIQPVFGIALTSVFFVIVHLQYAFTPAMLILLVVALGLGWLRWRFDLVVPVAAHLTYNLIPFLLIGVGLENTL
jgi:uncharacterized protein